MNATKTQKGIGRNTMPWISDLTLLLCVALLAATPYWQFTFKNNQPFSAGKNGEISHKSVGIGLINWSTYSQQGVSIGLINYAKELEGVQIGLLNVVGESFWEGSFSPGVLIRERMDQKNE
jgi:hypothetical protein